MARRSLASRLVERLHLPGGVISLVGKGDGRDGRSDTIWRRRPLGRRRRKTPHGGFCIISGRPRPAGSDSGDLSPPSSTPTAPTDLNDHMSVGPGERGGPRSSNGCSVDARSEGEGTDTCRTISQVPGY
jgi:hypothetical protein